MSERVEQTHGVRLLASLGAKNYVSGTVRARGDRPSTMQTPGIPDVESFLPSLGGRPRVLLKWECKAVGGRLRPEQAAYRELCLEAGIAHVVGPLDALIAWLAREGYIRADSVPHYRQPKGAPW